MQKTVNFKKKIIVSAIASAIGFSGAAFAQDEAEEIVVTGIKASLTRAMDIKREATGVVDAISAEDIGKMPDANLAESLQRISGVSIDRSNGEGSKVTVRGMAGDYNMVTVNGRQLPSATAANGGASITRSFDFANLASEGIAGVEVYKTGRADLTSGGIGAVINILTPHPLKTPGLKATVGVKAVADTSTKTGDKVTPEVSGLFSDTFADDTVGITINGSYQKRDNGVSNAGTGGWFSGDQTGGDWGSVKGAPGFVAPSGLYSNPVNVTYSRVEVSRERLNGQATFQYKPVDELTITADYLYVKQTAETHTVSTGMWFQRTGGFDIKWSDTSPKYPVSYTENTGVHDFDFNNFIGNTKSDLKSGGLNLVWEASDHLTLEFDGHNSSSLAGPDGKYGSQGGFSVATFRDFRPTVDFSGKIPLLHLAAYTDPGRTVLDTSANPKPELAQLSGNNFKIGIQDADVKEAQIKGTYKFDDSVIKNIKFGADRTEVSNKSLWIGIQMENKGSWSGVGSPSDSPDSLWKVDKLSNYFDNVSFAGAQDAFITYNLKDVMAFGGATYGSPTQTKTNICPNSYCANFTLDPTYGNLDGFSDQRTIEVSKSGYLQTTLESEFRGLPFHVTAGLRYESTEVLSKSYLATPSPSIIWKGGNEFGVQSGDRAFLSDTGGYDKLLPSFDYDISFTDTIKGRASFSKTIARPDYNSIAGGLTLTGARNELATASAGNPDLNPLEATNYDLSAEWYYDDASYVSLGYFKKRVNDFLGSQPTTVKESGLHTVVNGPRWKAAIADGAVSNDQIRDYIIAHAKSPSEYDLADGHKWIYALDEDPILPLEVTRPVNDETSTIHGFEASIQHTFGESGFGILANATKVSADVAYKDNLRGVPQFAIFGLSDSANLVGFYDKNGIQARIAYNWRDEFLLNTNDGVGGGPVYVEAYGQIDASVSYKLTENLILSLEGLNITNESTRTHGRDWHEVLNYTETGARYNIGARYNF